MTVHVPKPGQDYCVRCGLSGICEPTDGRGIWGGMTRRHEDAVIHHVEAKAVNAVACRFATCKAKKGEHCIFGRVKVGTWRSPHEVRLRDYDKTGEPLAKLHASIHDKPRVNLEPKA